MNNGASSLIQRKQLERHQAWASTRGIPKGNVRPMTLKLYAELTPNSTQLKFTTDIQKEALVKTEVRLRRDSLMFVNLFGLALHKVWMTGPTLKKLPHNTPLYFYPDKTVFPAAAVTDFEEWGCLESVYNGLLTMKTNQSIRLEEHPCNVFRQAPDTQYSAGPDTHASGGLQLVDLNTSLYLFGHRDNQFTIELGDDSVRDTIEGNIGKNKNYAVLILQGFEVVDGAKASLKIDDLENFVNQK